MCGEYIYKGKKFNSRKENVDDEDFLGLRIFRFYIRCPKCVAEIAFKVCFCFGRLWTEFVSKHWHVEFTELHDLLFSFPHCNLNVRYNVSVCAQAVPLCVCVCLIN